MKKYLLLTSLFSVVGLKLLTNYKNLGWTLGIFLLSFNLLTAQNEKYTVMLDAGHGGSDNGANNEKIYEKDINLSFVENLKSELEKQGIVVLTTRDKDEFVPLKERTEKENASNVNLFLSVHLNNSKNVETKGTEIFVKENNKENPLISNLSSKLLNDAESSGFSNRGLNSMNFYILQKNNSPSMVLELGFFSNPEDLSKITNAETMESLAKKMATSIASQLKNS